MSRAFAFAVALQVVMSPASAAMLGFHDASDPVKTLGWACATTLAPPVRVNLYAEVDGELKLLDTQLADKRRDDLPSVCVGPNHAFRFSDYARTPDGIALYAKPEPVRLHVFMETATGQQLLSGSPRSVSFAPVGLWDPGLRDGRWRTDFDNPFCANGPPGQSMPFARPGAGALFGVIALPDGEAGAPARKKMHLVLNSWSTVLCRTQSYGIPYMSVGAQADRGNNGVITYLNVPGAKRQLRFGITLMDIADANPNAFGKVPAGIVRYSQSHVLLEAMWGGRKRWLFIELMPDARRDLNAADGGIDLHIRFNWHMVDSFIYPGADYVFKSAAVLSNQCRNEGIDVPAQSPEQTYNNPATRAQSRREYAIDLQGVFDCLNRTGAWGVEPMPSHAVPVTAIHFGIEQDDRLYRNGAFTGDTAPNALWIAVDNVSVE